MSDAKYKYAGLAMQQIQTETLWQLEEQFWLGSPDFYEATLASDALMVLPPPVGVLERDATIASIRSGARWRNVTFEQQCMALVGEAAVLVYTAHADRGASNTAYVAQCSSTYVRAQGQWQLLAHHQSSVGQAEMATAKN